MAAAAKKPNPRRAQIDELLTKVETHYAAYATYDHHIRVELKLHDGPFTVVMRRGQDGGPFTYLVTDKSPEVGQYGSLTRVCRGTFAVEIEDAFLRLRSITLHVRANCDLKVLLEHALEADKTRRQLRSISKPASDDARTIEMVIKTVSA